MLGKQIVHKPNGPARRYGKSKKIIQNQIE